MNEERGSGRGGATAPAVPPEAVARDLRALGLGRGDTVLVHSAMSRIGYVPGGAPAVVDALLDVLGPQGTLAVPTFPFNGSMLAYVRSDPDFDLQATPSLMGAITEEVRRRPGARRSLEPTHPVAALGPAAEYLVDDHVNAAGPCDEHSPLYRLTRPGPAGAAGGFVLLLGVDFRNCTLLHTAEELSRVPFVDFRTRYRMRGRAPQGPYAMDIYCHSAPLPAAFPRIEPALVACGRLTLGRVGRADCRLARAADVLGVARERLAGDPYFLRRREPSPGPAA